MGYDVFNFISELARDLLGFANQGTTFLTDKSVLSTHWFIVTTLPVSTFGEFRGVKTCLFGSPSDCLTVRSSTFADFTKI